MQVKLSDKAKKDLAKWEKSGNRSILNKIGQLIKAILENPYQGIGKPEQLKYELAGRWSRRIDHEHRIIYRITNENTIEILNILSLNGHYD